MKPEEGSTDAPKQISKPEALVMAHVMYFSLCETVENDKRMELSNREGNAFNRWFIDRFTYEKLATDPKLQDLRDAVIPHAVRLAPDEAAAVQAFENIRKNRQSVHEAVAKATAHAEEIPSLEERAEWQRHDLVSEVAALPRKGGITARHLDAVSYREGAVESADLQISASQSLHEHHRGRAEMWSQLLSDELYLLPTESDRLMGDTTDLLGVPIWSAAHKTAKEIYATEKASIDDALIRNVFHAIEQ